MNSVDFLAYTCAGMFIVLTILIVLYFRPKTLVEKYREAEAKAAGWRAKADMYRAMFSKPFNGSGFFLTEFSESEKKAAHYETLAANLKKELDSRTKVRHDESATTL